MMSSHIAKCTGAFKRVKFRWVDLVFVVLLTLSLLSASDGPSMAEDTMDVLCLEIAGACAAGIVLRWGWLVPSTVVTWFILRSIPKFPSSAEDRMMNAIMPVIWAGIVAAAQVLFDFVVRLNRKLPSTVVQDNARFENQPPRMGER